MSRVHALNLTLLLVACGGEADDSGAPSPGLDLDADGYTAVEGDCDEGDPRVNPAAIELCDGLDNDCDGDTDEPDAQDATTFYADADGDGFGDASERDTACTQPVGYLLDATDCDDVDPEVNPAATELCNGVDDDCDGTVDEPDAVGVSTWYLDDDGDGWGDAEHSRVSCDQPFGYLSFAGDCDDLDASINPDAVDDSHDGVDRDCDGADEPVDLQDTHLVQLVISEVMPFPSGGLGVAGQWLEFTNASTWDVDLEGLEIQRGGRTLARVEEPAVLVAGGAYLVAHDDDSNINGGVVPDLASEAFELQDATTTVEIWAWGTALDVVEYSFRWYLSERTGFALALDQDHHHPDDNDDEDAWCFALEPYGAGGAGSPGVANGPCVGSLEDADGDGYTGPLYDGDDCDDLDPDRYPEAPEDCGDGIDQDCDGVLDCLDDACWGDGVCEDCSDGTDDDGDGLVDCEDGDCVGNPYCEELDCSDGLDSDNDGLVDCDDDDCWHIDCHPGGVASRVHAGAMTQRIRGFRTDLWRWAGALGWSSTTLSYAHSATVRSVWGTVQVLPLGVTSWDATSARSTCTWTVDSASMSWLIRDSHSNHSEHRPAVGRAPADVQAGCRVAGSWFLPSDIMPASGVGWADNVWSRSGWVSGTLWYQGSIVGGSTWHTTSTGGGSSPHAGSSWTLRSRSSSFEVLLSPHSGAWFVGP